MRYLPTLVITCLLILNPALGQSAYPEYSLAIDKFVSQLYPKGSHYFWVINDTSSEFSEEIIVDINASLQTTADENPKPSRFLLLIVKGKIKGAQNIPLGAKVDCKNEEEI